MKPKEPKRSKFGPHFDHETGVHILLEDPAYRWFDFTQSNFTHFFQKVTNRTKLLKSPKNCTTLPSNITFAKFVPLNMNSNMVWLRTQIYSFDWNQEILFSTLFFASFQQTFQNTEQSFKDSALASFSGTGKQFEAAVLLVPCTRCAHYPCAVRMLVSAPLIRLVYEFFCGILIVTCNEGKKTTESIAKWSATQRTRSNSVHSSFFFRAEPHRKEALKSESQRKMKFELCLNFFPVKIKHQKIQQNILTPQHHMASSLHSFDLLAISFWEGIFIVT